MAVSFFANFDVMHLMRYVCVIFRNAFCYDL